jgi:uncharacterized membrane protein YgdD (TMEM256/DUF423 family)
MQGEARRFCQLACVLLGLATALAALGAHVLRTRLAPEHYATLQTALQFQFWHSLGLLGVGLLFERVPTRMLQLAGWLLTIGIVLFSGSLYGLVAGAPRMIGVLTPIGGSALILGWCLAACGLRKRQA